ERNEFGLVLADLRLAAWLSDDCVDSPTMKNLRRRANCVGRLLDSLARTRLVASDLAAEIRRLHFKPPGARPVDEHDPPLIIQDANRLPERIEQPRQVLR